MAAAPAVGGDERQAFAKLEALKEIRWAKRCGKPTQIFSLPFLFSCRLSFSLLLDLISSSVGISRKFTAIEKTFWAGRGNKKLQLASSANPAQESAGAGGNGNENSWQCKLYLEDGNSNYNFLCFPSWIYQRTDFHCQFANHQWSKAIMQNKIGHYPIKISIATSLWPSSVGQEKTEVVQQYDLPCQ